MQYGVKLIYTYAVGKQNKRFYEESVLLIQADSFDEASEKAEAYGRNCCDEWVNPYNETVKTLGFEVLDCFLAFDEEKGIQEVYSSFHSNSGALDEDTYYCLRTTQCDAEECFPLRSKAYLNDT